MAELVRCAWAVSPAMREYHDQQWGVPVMDDRLLFEMLILEGAQAGLSWETILKRRDTYRAAFAGFDMAQVAAFGQKDTARLLADPGIIRNRAKVASAINNAQRALAAAAEFGSLAAFLWGLAGGAPVQNHYKSLSDVPAQTQASLAMSKALKKRGFTFVGPTICQAFMQAVGMLNDHATACYRHREVAGLAESFSAPGRESFAPTGLSGK